MSTQNPNEPFGVSEMLNDRIRHSIVFQEAALRTMREALELLLDQEADDDD
jgi:hypothetical protein